jgi:hypothetical protein
VQVAGYHRSWPAENAEDLKAIFAWRKSLGGAIFFLPTGSDNWPLMTIRVSGNIADVIYFPRGDHPDFRCIGGQGLPLGGWTTLVYEGADPASGEENPNAFVVPFDVARAVATDFFHTNQMSSAAS